MVRGGTGCNVIGALYPSGDGGAWAVKARCRRRVGGESAIMAHGRSEGAALTLREMKVSFELRSQHAKLPSASPSTSLRDSLQLAKHVSKCALRLIDELRSIWLENCIPSHCCTQSGLDGNQRKAPPWSCTAASAAPDGSHPRKMVRPSCGSCTR